MKKIILLLCVFLVPVAVTSQSKKAKKTAKKIDVFVNVDNFKSISVVDNTNSGLESSINRNLIRYGFETISSRVAKRRLAQIEFDRNEVNLNGSEITFKSSYVMVISDARGNIFELLSASIEIIDLFSGKVIGGASYRATIGGRSADVLGEAFVIALKKNLNK